MTFTRTRLNKLLHTKSFSSVYDIVGSYGNLFHSMGLNRTAKVSSVYRAACGETPRIFLDYEYVVSEKYNPLTNDNDTSCKNVLPSTSTIFYDLDEIAKRHSFHCFAEPSISSANFMKVMKMPVASNIFGEKATAIVQECSTQIHPKLLPRDSIEVNSKKVKKKYSRLSSEICLKDEEYLNDYPRNHYFKKDKPSRHQKYWSYSKYRTEYTKPIPEAKKAKKKDQGKRTEDPCPCQLFSYACPCTDKKSLTELARNSKSLTIVDQVTSTSKFETEQKKDTKINKKKKKRDHVMDDKPTNTSIVEMVEVTVPNKKNDPPIQIVNKKDVPTLNDANNNNKNTKNKIKAHKKLRRVLCPRCKEVVEVVISRSTTEEEESMNYKHSSIFGSKEISSTTAYACRAAASPNSHRSRTMESGDLCQHDPRCELLPVCQILPNDNFYNGNKKSGNKHSAPKTPRVIRITKACRHHPPCTVVPSCQRATVLKSNCEYIPPCLHRPRCVNLPLCVPFSKNLHYDEAANKVVEDMENTECPHIPRCKYIPVCQHDSLSTPVNQQINMISQVQNACEFLNDYNAPPFLLNQKQPNCGNTFSPCQLSPNNTYYKEITCKSNKSCQFDSSNYKCSNESNENPSDETVIFIRDVGCQFRNKSCSPQDSELRGKVSSNSFDFVDVKMGNYGPNIHTLRYEDKCTSPLSEEEQSLSAISVTSIDPDSEYPSHSQRPTRGVPKQRTTGFMPKSAYVTAYSVIQTQPTLSEDNKPETFPVKYRRAFLRSKYRKMFSVKRRRKSRISNCALNFASCNSTK